MAFCYWSVKISMARSATGLCISGFILFQMLLMTFVDLVGLSR